MDARRDALRRAEAEESEKMGDKMTDVGVAYLVYLDPTSGTAKVRRNNRENEVFRAPEGLNPEKLPTAEDVLAEQHLHKSAAESLAERLGVSIHVLEVPHRSCWQYAGVVRPCLPECMAFRWDHANGRQRCVHVDERVKTNQILGKLLPQSLREEVSKLRSAISNISIRGGFR